MQKQKKYHYIYKTTNLIKGYFYIGMHSTNDLEDEYMGSGKRLRYSINKYGVENHKFEILEFLTSRKELKDREKEIINEDLLKDELCINLKIGGEGGWDHISIEKKRLGGKKVGKANAIKILSNLTFEQRSERTKKAAKTRKARGDDITLNARLAAATPKANEKRKNTFREIGHQQGEKNSQYGKMWIYNEETFESIRILKDEIIPDGWKKGRKSIEIELK
jgi:hypothetical protein